MAIVDYYKDLFFLSNGTCEMGIMVPSFFLANKSDYWWLDKGNCPHPKKGGE